MAVPLADRGGTVDRGDDRIARQRRVIGAEPHRAAQIALRLALLQPVAAHPFGDQPDDRLTGRAELGR